MVEPILKEHYEWTDGIIAQFGKTRTSLIPVLQSVQSRFKYLPEEIMSHIATQMTLPLSSVYGVATFYAQFSTEPKGKHIVQICDGTACHVRGAKALIDKIRKDYELNEEKRTTDDYFLTLETVACIGACAMAPAVIIDGHIYGHMTADNLSNLINDMKEGE